MKRILWISDFGGSGYTTASIETLNGFSLYNEDEYELYLYAINNYSNYEYHNNKIKDIMLKYDKIKLIVPEKNIMICNLPFEERYKRFKISEIMGFRELVDVLRVIMPDVCVILNDNVYSMDFYKLIKKSKIDTKIIAYMPIDCHNFRTGEFDYLEVFDKIFTMTDFAKNEIVKANFKKEITVLNHPISTNFFKPIDKIIARKSLDFLKEIPDIENAYILLNFNDNTPERKHVEKTVRAFAMFMRKYPDVNAYLIIKKKRPSIMGTKEVDYDEYLNIYSKLYDKIIYIPRHLNYEEINYLYNSADVGINSCYGEGWGLIACEMALCNVPQILPDNTCHREIFKNSCKLIETDDYIWGKTLEERKNESSNIILWCQGILENVNSGIVNRSSYIKDNELPFNFKIFVSERVVNEEYAVGMLKISDTVIFQTGTNKLQNVKKFIRKYKPEGFQIYIETDTLYKRIFEQTREFDWEELLDIYQMEQILNKDIEVLYGNHLITHKLPKDEKIFEAIEFYYNNLEQRIEDGKKCRNEILYYSKERIGRELYNIFNELTKNTKIIRSGMEDVD